MFKPLVTLSVSIACTVFVGALASNDRAVFGQAPTASTPAADSAANPPVPSSTSTGSNGFNNDFLIGNAVSDPNSPQYKDVTEAMTRFRNNDMSAARELLTRARQSNPKLPPVEILMGKMLAAANQLPAAMAEWEKAVIAYPIDPEPYLNFADLALAQHRVTDAESDLLHAKSLIDKFNENLKRKRNFDINYNSRMALVMEARNQWSDAVPLLKTWLELDPDQALAHAHMGHVLFELGKPTDAYNEFEAAMKADSKQPNPYIALAQLYEQAKDRKNAAQSIAYAIQKNPKDLNVHLQAAVWAMQTNQLNEAQKYAEDALKIDPKSLEAKVIRGEIARYTGDLKTAQTYLEQAVTQAPAYIRASNQLALVLIESSDKADQDRAEQFANQNFRATMQGNQADPEVAATYAWVLYKLGRTAEAEQLLSKILSLGTISPNTAYYFGKILQDRGKTDEAVKVLESALSSPTPFAQRQATSELLQQLKKEKDQKDKAGSSSGSSSQGNK
jgi:tetratricopeptide (TPR) repeat protein